ncbi:hypothetical protein EM61_020275 [Vibrio parahaemolyticus]|uniref:hypothetical protein n=1 Tax=Vibrio parahaemolyticus TaxID=670 RepID=UPI0004031646|nr:hypothetical protein [Vibrio parahaemolyticus]ELN6894062.1 hypothetical protein [Vibrio cholerae]EIK4811108.1 hypothetical protein [Vibrio parahaemolyticus]EKC5524109.1 hypothetical protein [Vibrio parahaemolyticus]KKC79442.1 hypothetical protein WR32_00070 [Vibrio parahaemolyticus]KKX76970.1 hypothetical protein UF35_08525 [Vibrio parahaemolyticus]
MSKTKVKIAPPTKQTQTATDTPASSKASSAEETKNIQFKVTPVKHIEIKSFAAERGLTLKELFLSLYENERMKE